MEIDLQGIIVIVGNYGSGKTEVSINLAVTKKRTGVDVKIADLDLVNPYFRTREARSQLGRLGIDMALPQDEYLQADLPILSPVVAGLIKNPVELTIVDAGGDDAGATVLAALSDAFKGKSFQMLQVVNPLRPFTNTIKGCLKMRSEIEVASKMKINGIVGNANLIDETQPENIYSGYEFVKLLSEESGLALKFITAPSDLMTEIDISHFSCPVLQIERQLVPPWKKAVKLS
ncbi:MAG: division plane positioning ATPase MipZ [Deltaproteobacteria bacterium]|nr:division plane positioning ATPase MipZ [Deltaproteobacteria bacterium]MBT8359133.1 division plane positioning ATPase MipZ [Deltaproteobacteria bacterium]NNL41519.1 cobalamin biosynthesis protein CbiA [Desulfobacterales bacterium]